MSGRANSEKRLLSKRSNFKLGTSDAARRMRMKCTILSLEVGRVLIGLNGRGFDQTQIFPLLFPLLFPIFLVLELAEIVY